MKTKLTVTVDADVLPVAKQYARSQGVSLSSLIDRSLRAMIARDTSSFASRWRGRFRPAERDDARYRALAEKYLQMLLDTDVLIDLALDRQPYSQPVADLLEQIQATGYKAFIAWHTVANFHYVVSPSSGRRSARDFIVELTRFVGVAAGDAQAIRYAASLPMKDFEDAMQVAAARFCGASRIVTRNVKDYERSPIPAITPQQALGARRL